MKKKGVPAAATKVVAPDASVKGKKFYIFILVDQSHWWV